MKVCQFLSLCPCQSSDIQFGDFMDFAYHTFIDTRNMAGFDMLAITLLSANSFQIVFQLEGHNLNRTVHVLPTLNGLRFQVSRKGKGKLESYIRELLYDWLDSDISEFMDYANSYYHLGYGRWIEVPASEK